MMQRYFCALADAARLLFPLKSFDLGFEYKKLISFDRYYYRVVIELLARVLGTVLAPLLAFYFVYIFKYEVWRFE